MKIDQTLQLRSRTVQSRLKIVHDFLSRESLHYIVQHNMIEHEALHKAYNAINDLINLRTGQWPKGL